MDKWIKRKAGNNTSKKWESGQASGKIEVREKGNGRRQKKNRKEIEELEPIH